MEIAAAGNAEYTPITPDKVNTRLSLDLQTVDALDPSRIAEDLKARSNEIRSQIFRKIANEVIPSMMEGREMEIPEQWSIESNGSGTGSMVSPSLSNGVLNTDHHLEVDFSFRADREIDPATMIYLARAQIAGHIADSTVFDLESRFLGKTESNVSSEHSMEDGMVDDYQVTEEIPNAYEGSSTVDRSQPITEGLSEADPKEALGEVIDIKWNMLLKEYLARKAMIARNEDQDMIDLYQKTVIKPMEKELHELIEEWKNMETKEATH